MPTPRMKRAIEKSVEAIDLRIYKMADKLARDNQIEEFSKKIEELTRKGDWFEISNEIGKEFHLAFDLMTLGAMAVTRHMWSVNEDTVVRNDPKTG